MNKTPLIRPLSRDEVRSLDVQAARELALPTLTLMENAGRGAAALLAELAAGWPPARASRPFSGGDDDSPLPGILVLAGPGNNGGDGGVVARHLDAWGFPVRIVWLARRDQLQGDALAQWTILERAGIDQSAWFEAHPPEPDPDPAELDRLLSGADWLVDGLLGTGLTRPVEGPLRRVVEAMNRSSRPILALDLPSGLDADTGVPLGGVAVRARATATFVARKRGFLAPGASGYTGEVTVIDIGLPRRILKPYEAV